MIGISAPVLETERAVREIIARPGLIPVDIDLEVNRLVWMDIGSVRLEESFFFVSTHRFLEQTPEPFKFSTGLDILDRSDLLTDGCHPSGFIYHLGRSGSTLLSKALSSVPTHLVVSEAPPQFFIWPLLSGGWRASVSKDEQNIRRFRNLTLALGRRRQNDYDAHFVKFTSYVVLSSDFIQAAFPDVPALFLYRQPAEVLVAMGRQGPGWRRFKNSDFGVAVSGMSRDQLATVGEMAFYAACLRQFMNAALRASTRGLTLANYDLLRRDKLSAFLAALQRPVKPGELQLMQSQFDYNAKDDGGKRRFVSDVVAKRQAVTLESETLLHSGLIELYQHLQNAPGNLIHQDHHS